MIFHVEPEELILTLRSGNLSCFFTLGALTKAGKDLFDGSYVISQLGFLLPHEANCLPKAHIPSPGFNYEEASQDHKKHPGAEIEDPTEKLDDYETDRDEGQACLHIGVHGPLP
jgi:hypothetical protein